MVARLGDNHEAPLARRLRELAAHGNHERAIELFARAADVDRAASDPNISIELRVALWARARRLLCDLTGEDLI